MDTKIIVFICVVGAASASVLDPFPQYSYGYDVQDALSGDYKGHQEQRNGDLVTGSYTVVDPDGTRRIVDYTADPLNGFNAVVRREPLIAAVPARAAVPVLPRTPLFASAPAPVFAPAPVPRLPNPYFF